MTGGYLKLTTYFGERLRYENRFLADALLDLYGERAVATSVVLRGISSFGPHHPHLLRSDLLLSMSEDTPIEVAAVDTADSISPLAEQVVAMTSRGLITLERAMGALPTQAGGPPTQAGGPPTQAGGPPARRTGGLSSASPGVADSVKLTVYLGRRERVGKQPAHRAVCDVLYRHGFAGASVFLGVDGTKRGQRRRARFFSRNADVPVMIVSVGTGRQVDTAVPELQTLLWEPLLTVERVQVCKRGGELQARPPTLPSADEDGNPLWQKLMVHTSEATLHDGVPIHRAIVRRLRQSRAASGATVLRGVWGFHGDHKPHGDKLIQLSRQVPVLTVVVDSPARIAASFDIVDEITDRHGLVTSELVPALVAVDGGASIGGTRLAHYDF